ncbi:MAG: hypothetical protein M1819_004620 [Sarea resinae]|nr:MAG: hypothetical protein M1819_004620 [Sarea resinae]
MLVSILISLLLVLQLSSASPIAPRTLITSSQLLEIAPSSSTCANAPFPLECATATQAAPWINLSLATYAVTSPAEIAALISLMAFETGEFKYNINHYPAPGRPGQGTRNMQMGTSNLLYARSIPALTLPLDAITTSQDASALSDDQLNAMRALVLPDTYAWASAAWFLTSQCGPSVRTQLQTGSVEGWEAYISECVGTTVTSDRQAYWTAACQALGVSPAAASSTDGSSTDDS